MQRPLLKYSSPQTLHQRWRRGCEAMALAGLGSGTGPFSTLPAGKGTLATLKSSVAVGCDLTTHDHQSVRWQGAQPQESNDGLGVDVTTVAFIFMYVDVISGGEGLSQMMYRD